MAKIPTNAEEMARCVQVLDARVTKMAAMLREIVEHLHAMHKAGRMTHEDCSAIESIVGRLDF